MLLPRGDVILENTKVRFFDFESLKADAFESVIKKTEALSGYASITYANHKDILIVWEGQIRETFSFSPANGRHIISLDQVIANTKDDYEGVVNYYRMPRTFLEMFHHASTEHPLVAELTSRFIDWEPFLASLGTRLYDGFLEITCQGMLGYLSLARGVVNERFFYREPDFSGTWKLKLFPPPPAYFVSLGEQLQLTFLDVFNDMLKTCYSIIAQASDPKQILEKSLMVTTAAFPQLLTGVKNAKSGLIDFDRLLTNFDDIPPRDKRTMFISCFIELLYQRLLLIREHFDEEIFDRTLIELKLIQIYHQQALQQFNVAASFLGLWSRFDEGQ